MKKTSERLGCFMFIVFAIVFCFACGDISEDKSKDNKKEHQEYTAAEKIYMVDEEAPLNRNDVNFIRTQYLIRNIAQSFHESEDTIAEYTSKAQSYLRNENGLQFKCREIMENLVQIKNVPINTPYKDVITLYTTMVTKK